MHGVGSLMTLCGLLHLPPAFRLVRLIKLKQVVLLLLLLFIVKDLSSLSRRSIGFEVLKDRAFLDWNLLVTTSYLEIRLLIAFLSSVVNFPHLVKLLLIQRKVTHIMWRVTSKSKFLRRNHYFRLTALLLVQHELFLFLLFQSTLNITNEVLVVLDTRLDCKLF